MNLSSNSYNSKLIAVISYVESCFPVKLPKNKSAISNECTETVATQTRISLTNSFNENMERSDLKFALKKEPEKKLVKRFSVNKYNDESLTSSYIMAPKATNDFSHLEKCRKTMNQCFIVENFVEDQSQKLPFEIECGLALHRSSTTTSFTNSESFSKVDYNETMHKNMINRKRDAILTNESIPMKKFPRKSFHNPHNKTSINRCNNNCKRKIECDVCPSTSKTPKSGFEILFEYKNKEHMEPKVMETYSNEDVCKIDNVLLTAPNLSSSSFASTSNTTNQQKKPCREIYNKINKQSISKIASNESHDEVISVVNYESNENLPWQTREEHNITLNIPFNYSTKQSGRFHVNNLLNFPFEEISKTQKDNSVCHSLINKYFPAHDVECSKNLRQNPQRNCVENNYNTSYQLQDNKQEKAAPPINLNDFFSRPSKIDYLKFETGTNCVEKSHMFMKISDLQATIKKLYLGEKINRIPPIDCYKNKGDIDKMINKESIFGVYNKETRNTKRDDNQKETSSSKNKTEEIYVGETKNEIRPVSDKFTEEDLVKTVEFNQDDLTKTVQFTQEDLAKTVYFNQEDLVKTVDFNQEDLVKIVDFNQEYLAKTIDFNQEALTNIADFVQEDLAKSVDFNPEDLENTKTLNEKDLAKTVMFNQEDLANAVDFNQKDLAKTVEFNKEDIVKTEEFNKFSKSNVAVVENNEAKSVEKQFIEQGCNECVFEVSESKTCVKSLIKTENVSDSEEFIKILLEEVINIVFKSEEINEESSQINSKNYENLEEVIVMLFKSERIDSKSETITRKHLVLDVEKLDDELKVIYENEIEPVKSSSCICFDINDKLNVLTEDKGKHLKRKKSQKIKTKNKQVENLQEDEANKEKSKRKSKEFCSIS